MRILFTGASSFTGFWIVQNLAAAGHDVCCTFTGHRDSYDGLRRQRVESTLSCAKPLWGCRFGDSAFLDAVSSGGDWDVLCHHGADVHNYKSPDFDSFAALGNNTHNLRQVLDTLCENGCQRIVLTGTVFEAHEGEGSDDLPAFSPYGLSKGLTCETFRYYCGLHPIRLGKFVIPNPFGPWEEPRFTSYLAKTWLSGKPATCDYPDYVRDNIHVSLLAKAYCKFMENLSTTPGFEKFCPSGYAETQGEFTKRFSRELAQRLSIPCEVVLKPQTQFPEPRARVNTTALNLEQLGWNESQAWDSLADYCQAHYQ